MLIILLDIFSHHYRIYIKNIYIGSLDFFNSLESILFYLSSVISDTPEFYFFFIHKMGIIVTTSLSFCKGIGS